MLEDETVVMTVRVGREAGETFATLTDRHGRHIAYTESSAGVLVALSSLVAPMVEHAEGGGPSPAGETCQVLRLHRGSRADGPPVTGGSGVAA